MKLHVSRTTLSHTRFFNTHSVECHRRPRRSRLQQYLLVVSIVAAFISWSAPTFADDDWMSDNWQTIKDRRLRDIVLPGTHDSGTYSVDVNAPAEAVYSGYATLLTSFPASGSSLAFLTDILLDKIEGYAKTQSLSIYEQLNAGSRYFDLRFLHFVLLSNSTYCIHHTLMGDCQDKIFGDIERFLAEPGHEKEIIILNFNHMVGSGSKGKFTVAEHKEFLRGLAPLKKYMAKQTGDNFLVTPQALFDQGKQLIIYYEGHSKGSNHYAEYGATENLLWTGIQNTWMGQVEKDYGRSESYPDPSRWQSEDSIENDWLIRLRAPSTKNKNEGHAFISALPFGMDNSGRMFLNSLSSDPDVIGWGSLANAAKFSNPRIIPHIAARPREHVNILTVDYIEKGGLLREVIKLNKHPARVSLKIKSVEIGAKDGACCVNLEDCDFYPVFTINDNVSEQPVSSLSLQHQRGRVIDNDDYVDPVPNGYWTYTTAVPYESVFSFRITIYDDDPSPFEDEYVQTVYANDWGSVLDVTGADGCYEQELEFGSRSGEGARIVFSVHIEPWDLNPGTCGLRDNIKPEWNKLSDITQVLEIGESSAEIEYLAFASDNVGLAESYCQPSSGSRFPANETTVLCTATDTSGNIGYKSFSVTVLDEEPPEIMAPASIEVEANGLQSVVDIGSATATDNVGVVRVFNDAPATFPLGTTVVTWSAIDAAGNTATAQQSVIVVDTTPPSILALSATPSILWSPNKTMRPVSVTVEVEDVVDDSPTCELVDVQVNQAAALGNKRATLFEITGPNSALLLVDRNGQDGDRRYTLHVNCTDFTGNASSATTDVVVPHDRRR